MVSFITRLIALLAFVLFNQRYLDHKGLRKLVLLLLLWWRWCSSELGVLASFLFSFCGAAVFYGEGGNTAGSVLEQRSQA